MTGITTKRTALVVGGVLLAFGVTGAAVAAQALTPTADAAAGTQAAASDQVPTPVLSTAAVGFLALGAGSVVVATRRRSASSQPGSRAEAEVS